MINYKSIKCLYTIEDPDEVSRVAITPDGEKFVSSAYFPLKVRQTNTGRLLHTLYPDELAWSLAISEDSQLLAAGCDEQTTTVWNLQTGEKLHTFHHSMEFPREVSAVAFTPDKKILLSGGAGEIDLWDLQTGEKLHTLHQTREFPREVKSVVISPDKKILLSGSGGHVSEWDLQTGKLLLGAMGSGSHMALSEDGEILVGNHLSSIEVIDFPSGGLIHQLEYPQPLDCVHRVAINGDNRYFALGDDLGQVQILSINSGQACRTWKAHQDWIKSIIFCPDNQTLITSGRDRLIKFWHWRNGQHIHSLEAHPRGVYSLALSGNGRILVSCNSRPSLAKDQVSLIKVWSV